MHNQLRLYKARKGLQLKFKVQGAHYNNTMRALTKNDENWFRSLGWASFERLGLYLPPWLSIAAQLKPLNRFQRILYRKLKMCVSWRTSKPNREIVALEEPRVLNDLICEQIFKAV